jgi:hypothetical protein
MRLAAEGQALPVAITMGYGAFGRRASSSRVTSL